MTASVKTVVGQLASAVADAGTFTVSYPARISPEIGSTNAGDFFQGFFHRLVMNQAILLYPDDFDVSFGTSSITITNKTGSTWAADSKFTAQFDEPGKRVYGVDARNKSLPIVRTAREDLIRIRIGAPDILDADGICASQSIAVGTATTATSATLDGALASTNATTGRREAVLDVPRALVAAWTTTAVLTFEGYDEYGTFMVEKSASGTSHTGTKAFKRVTRVWSTVAITSASVGTSDVLGLPVYLPSLRNVRSEYVDGLLAGNDSKIYLPVQINSTDFLAGTAQQVVAPTAGRVTRISSIVQVALPATVGELGTVAVTINGTAITGSTLTSYSTATGGNGSVGDVASALIPLTSDATVVRGDAIAIVASSTWASAGAINALVEIAPSGGSIYQSGTFVVGITTAGGSTATTGDVRGTYTPPVACDGSFVFELLVSLTDPGNLGATQWAVP